MQHTTSFGVSERLEAAGYNRETMFVWINPLNPKLALRYHVEDEPDLVYLPAPTLGELIRELPNHHLRSPKFPNGLFSVTNWATRFVKQATTPEDAAGLALEALLKKGI